MVEISNIKLSKFELNVLRLKFGTIKSCNYHCEEFVELIAVNEKYDIYTVEPYELGLLTKEQVFNAFEKIVNLAHKIINDFDDEPMTHHEAIIYLAERLDDTFKEKNISLSLF